ncbi:protein phosphatase inhibitor 2-like isoform X3 [Mangifera indica]|uniref:protein phosphatase inhibitor 2-like isoform X3 n=1 Tax=Mangifera indica TaxID=29780 RepID=UPI001CFBB291|nr:protein phosphatase inhibitor 2-like isoform X3 [Mangifera indica]
MKGRVRWDEANLNEINTNKPVRKKIDEPKTPYHPILGEDGSSSSPRWDSSDAISYAAHAEAVRIALNKLAVTQKLSTKSGEAMDTEEVEKFEEHRRARNDEFKKIREVKRKGPFWMIMKI